LDCYVVYVLIPLQVKEEKKKRDSLITFLAALLLNST